MALHAVGAGLPRTGTHSLKLALERLLGGPCYHMIEVFGHPEHIGLWLDATKGQPPDWKAFFDGWTATVDWPGSAFWSDIADDHPDAVVVLSHRGDAETWWRSADKTVWEVMRRPPFADPRWHEMAHRLARRLCDPWDDANAAMAAYERHNAAVRAQVPPDRLVEWQPAEGWGPLCRGLGVAVPDDAFPVTNTTAEFRAGLGFDA
jgi:hypothetical protein